MLEEQLDYTMCCAICQHPKKRAGNHKACKTWAKAYYVLQCGGAALGRNKHSDALELKRLKVRLIEASETQDYVEVRELLEPYRSAYLKES